MEETRTFSIVEPCDRFAKPCLPLFETCNCPFLHVLTLLSFQDLTMLRVVTHPPICTHTGAALHLMGLSLSMCGQTLRGPIEMEMRPLRPCSRNSSALTPLQTIMELQKRLVCNDQPSFDCYTQGLCTFFHFCTSWCHSDSSFEGGFKLIDT